MADILCVCCQSDRECSNIDDFASVIIVLCNLHVTNFGADRAQSFVIYKDRLNFYCRVNQLVRRLLSRVVKNSSFVVLIPIHISKV